MASDRRDRVYRFDPADGSGVFLGLGVIQCGLTGGGLVMAVAALTQGVPLPLAALPGVAAVGLSFARVRGHAAWEWLPLATSWLVMRLGRGPRWFARIPLLVEGEAPPMPLPPCLAGLRLIEVPWRGRQVLGAVLDEERHTLTAAVRVAGPQFGVQARGDQERLLAGWGDILNQFAVERGPVTHVAWSDLAAPSGLGEHRAWASRRGSHSLPQPYSGCCASASTHTQPSRRSSAAASSSASGSSPPRTQVRRLLRWAGGTCASTARSTAATTSPVGRGCRSAPIGWSRSSLVVG